MILVTGNEGFIGKHLTKKLNDLGLDWIGYDLLTNNNDIRDLQRLDRCFDTYQPDIVIHLAALAGARRGEAYPQEYFDTNVIGTENVARMCEKYKVVQLIVFSSSSAKSCQNTYGITKYAMELMLKKIKVPSLIVVRPFNVYGENGRRDQVIWKWKSLADRNLPIEYHGDLKRNYTYVGDIVDGVVRLLGAIGSGTFDFASRKQVSLNELLEVFKERYPGLQVIEKEMDDVSVFPEPAITAGTDFITKVKELIK